MRKTDNHGWYGKVRYTTFNMSHPAKGAWIEIYLRIVDGGIHRRRTPQGACVD